MAQKYVKLAQDIVLNIGGASNINSVTNCMTRLRFSLKDRSIVDLKHLKEVNGVQGVVDKSGQFQVVIGTDVSHVFDEISKMGTFKTSMEPNEDKAGIVSRILGVITAIFQPVISAICGAGMIKAVLAILVVAKVLTVTSQSYILLNMVADTAFYFLPIFLAFSSAKQFGCNTYFAAVLGAILIHPTFAGLVSAGEVVFFFGLPVKLVSYGSAVVPSILIVFVQSYVEKFAKKIVPNAVKVFMVPLIVFLVMAPLALVAVGPLGAMVGDSLLVVFTFLNNEARWLLPVLMGTFCPLIVMTGMHYSFIPVQLAQYATLGYGTLLGPGMLASNIAQAAAALVIGLKTKNKELKQTALSASTTAWFGITEPALYGVTMKLKKPLIAVMIGGGVAGLWGGLTNMRTYASASAGLLALPVYITEDLSNIRNAVICIIISVVITVIMTLILGFDDPKEKTIDISKEKSSVNVLLGEKAIIHSPVSGKVVPLNEVDDDVFSNEITGKGIAVIPSVGRIVSPCNGTVTAIFSTKHAIGITDSQGVELLIHVGLNTVELEGKYFKTVVEQGTQVSSGELLLEFDIAGIQKAGYDVITPIIVTNSKEFVDVIPANISQVNENDVLLTIFK